MQYNPANPLIVQGDRTVLLEVDNPQYPEARDALAPFAELEKSPEHIHTYRLTPLSLWNAAAAGMTADAMIDVLTLYSKFPIPANVPVDIEELVSPLRPRAAEARRQLTPAGLVGRGAPRGACPAERCPRLPGRAGRPDELRHRRRLPRRAQAGA